MNDFEEKTLKELKDINDNTAHINLQSEELTDIKKSINNIETLLTDIRDYLKDLHYYKFPNS